MEENGENNYTLTIDNIEERNLGNYTCQAVNKIGDRSSTIDLKGNLRFCSNAKNTGKQKVRKFLHHVGYERSYCKIKKNMFRK